MILMNCIQQYKICPYFLSKKSIGDAEVICVPYVTLLDEKMRESSNIDITNAIIIFDESHNILESLSGIHSNQVIYKSIFAAFLQLLTYYDKFCRRLNPKNALFIQNIKNLCLELLKYIKSEIENCKDKKQNYIKVDNIQLLLKLNMDRIDFFQIKKFTEETRLGQKIHFYSQSTKYVSSNIPPVIQKLIKDTSLSEQMKNVEYMVVDKVMNFLWKMQDSINKSDKYSIIIKDIAKLEDASIQILCLDVIEPLQKVIEESACVVLAGGTMEPLSEFELLINKVGRHNYFNFSCGHVIAQSNCSAFCISSLNNNSAQSENIIFNYQNKLNDSLLSTSIHIISQLAIQIPDGLVFFVQSYSFLERLKNKLLEDTSSLNSIQSYKKIFMDEKDNSNNSLLERYQKEIEKERIPADKRNGAILISVIGGRLSEGINFSDKLARCVVVLGMPYSNVKSAELIEKMSHYDKISRKAKTTFSGNDYYENLCMKSVNQAIGRSIRHKNDYAVILLIDSRFSLDKNLKRLSGWIRDRTTNSLSFDTAKLKIQQFFENKERQ